MKTTKRNFLKGLVAAPVLAAPATILTNVSLASAASQSPEPTGPAPGFYKYRVGSIEVTALLDGYTAMPNQLILGYDEKAARDATAAQRLVDEEETARKTIAGMGEIRGAQRVDARNIPASVKHHDRRAENEKLRHLVQHRTKHLWPTTTNHNVSDSTDYAARSGRTNAMGLGGGRRRAPHGRPHDNCDACGSVS